MPITTARRIATRWCTRDDGQRLILSGHHRAAAALLQGTTLAVRVVAKPWGRPRTQPMPPAPLLSSTGPPQTVFLTPRLSTGVAPAWDHDLATDERDAVGLVRAGRRCHFDTTAMTRSDVRSVHLIALAELGLSAAQAREHALFATTGGLAIRHRDAGDDGTDPLARLGQSRVLTPADASVRQRVGALSVHLSCGSIRGPRPPYGWQSCQCEDAPEVWAGCDVSHATDLCILCLRGTAGGTIRWSWQGCDSCREVNTAVGRLLGRGPIPLGRHSIMNGAAIPIVGDPQVIARAEAAFLGVVAGWTKLLAWNRAEFRRLASSGGWPAGSDVPLAQWQQRFAPSPAASQDAFRRFTGIDPQAFCAN